MHQSNNKNCIQIDTDHDGNKFMNVHKPEHVRISVYDDKTVVVRINDSCVFRIDNAGTLRIDNLYGSD